MTDKYLSITSGVIGALKDVRLYDSTVAHVVAEHREVPILLPSILSAVQRAITNPTHIEGSYGGAFVFVDAQSTNASGDPLRIPVQPVTGTSGRVRTVYFASTSGEADIIWRRQADGQS